MHFQQHIDKTYACEDIASQTHTFFGITGRRKLTVQENQFSKFLERYVSYCSRNADPSDVTLSTLNSITEKAKQFFKFFVDIDLKYDHFASGKVEYKDVPSIIKNIHKLFQQVISEAYDDELIGFSYSAFRMSYKCHLYFPNLITTSEDAKVLCSEVSRRFKEANSLYSDLDIIDTSVYRTGLRMLYSHKGSMTKNLSTAAKDEKEKHESLACDLDPYSCFYRLGNINDDGSVDYNETFTVEDVMKTSIITYEQSARVFSEEFKQKNVFRPRKRAKVTLKDKSPSLATMDMDVDTEASNDPETIVQSKEDQLTENEQTLVTAYVTQELSSRGIDPTILEIKTNAYGSVLAILQPQMCPFAHKVHQRTADRNVPTLHVVLNAFESSLRCFDDQCEDTIPLRPPGDDLLQMLQGLSDDFLLKRSLYKQTHETVAEFIFSVVKTIYSATPSSISGSNYLWYYFDKSQHRWVQQEKIMSEIMNPIGIVHRTYNEYIGRICYDPNLDNETIKTTKTLWLKLERELQTTGFVRGGVLPILARKLEQYWATIILNVSHTSMTFSSKLDDNAELMCFRNGVWDFRTNVFRPGQPTDFISLSTNINYTPYEQIDENLRKGLGDFLAQIYPKENHLAYVLREISLCLNGIPNQQRFFLMTGRGANGKSTFTRLLHGSFGEYAGECSVTMFTKPSPGSSQVTPDLFALKGKRFISTSEPEAKDILQLGKIKALSGGDKIVANPKYQALVSFYIQATFFCLCNDIPQINASASDYGTWRRLKPIAHLATFKEKPDPSKPYEFSTDDEINHKLFKWREALVSLLIKIYLENKRVPVPLEFSSLLKELNQNCDVYNTFIDEMLNKDSEEFMDKLSLYAAYESWYSSRGKRGRPIYEHFEKHMKELLGTLVDNEGKLGWNVGLKQALRIV